jgi:hypothetical protein
VAVYVPPRTRSTVLLDRPAEVLLGEPVIQEPGQEFLALSALLSLEAVKQSLARVVHRRILSNDADVR